MARLLIVEDHPELASLLVAAAESRGHEATAVHTGEAALALLRPGAFHAAVVDLLLPDMRGTAVLSALREHSIPAVAVSGVFKGERFSREATEVYGARAFFEKPFELLQLLESIEQLCGLTHPLYTDDDSEEVVVFEDASLLDLDDEPVFTSTGDDEPVFSPSPEEQSPRVQGLAIVEETRTVAAPAPEEPPAPVEEMLIPTTEETLIPTTEETPVSETRAPDAQEAPPQDAQEAPPREESSAPDTDEFEFILQDNVPPAQETATVQAPPVPPQTEDPEELKALDSLAPVEPPPTPDISAEELKALDSLAPAEQPEPTPEDSLVESLQETSGASEPEPGLALPFGEREKVWTKTASAEPRRRPPPEWALAGDLKNTSVPRLLNVYYETRHSGELKLRQGSVLKVVYFDAGRPVYAASNLTQERFARFCVRRGALPEAKLQEVTTLAREQNIRSSEAMMRLGLLDARQRQQLVTEQVKEILVSTFSWTEGTYGFSPLRPPRAGLVKLALFPGEVIIEGTFRSEPLMTLRQRMPRSRRLFPSAAPPYALYELKLQGAQALLLAYADGSKTVEDLLTLTDLPERDVLATLRGLELSGVLEERRDESGNRSRISFGL